jgi:hypothetical protein
MYPDIITAVFVFTTLAALLAPLIRYLAIGWRAKRKDIMDGMSAYARFAYFQMFSRSETLPQRKRPTVHWIGEIPIC